jgi:hypothetical protein
MPVIVVRGKADIVRELRKLKSRRKYHGRKCKQLDDQIVQLERLLDDWYAVPCEEETCG